MKRFWIIGIPLAFVAGLLSTVFLQFSGIIQISPPVSPPLSPKLNSSEPLISSTVLQSGDSNNEISLDDSNLQLQIEKLQQQVVAAAQDRDDLRVELLDIQKQLTDRDFSEPFLPTGESTEVPTAPPAGNDPTRRGRGRFGEPDSNEQYSGLIAAGIDPAVASDIKQRHDQWELARLELIDTAEREGWRRSDQFTEEMMELREQRVNVRDELGDYSYDKYLYSSGENNRVRIDNIISGSAAQQAGMEQGDVVISYANLLIFTHRQLQRATREGARGEAVPVVVRRSGQYVNLSVVRGPLGVTLLGYREEPTG